MKYQLEKYKPGGSNRYTCPHCGKSRCFSRYVRIDTGEQVGDTCGRCNHGNSCGYHLTPSQYFAQHPGAWEKMLQNDSLRTYRTPTQLPSIRPLCTLPQELISQSLSTKSVFCRWLKDFLRDDESFHRVCQLYQLGATQDGGVIFWQLDRQRQLRSGKIMHYRTDGHRRGNPNWVHSIMIRKGWLPADWQLSQCLFGEHLLGKANGQIVDLLESEKTAVLMSAILPDHICVATGGCDLLSPDKVRVLRGYHICVYPDSGCFEKWSKMMAQTAGIDYVITDALEKYPKNTDIGDLIVQGLPLPLIE